MDFGISFGEPKKEEKKVEEVKKEEVKQPEPPKEKTEFEKMQELLGQMPKLDLGKLQFKED
jgi:hypothetical protein